MGDVGMSNLPNHLHTMQRQFRHQPHNYIDLGWMDAAGHPQRPIRTSNVEEGCKHVRQSLMLGSACQKKKFQCVLAMHVNAEMSIPRGTT